ncbi:sigma-54 interaction domain-containing protein [Halopseudomonas maritima]|uniref:sigma-54 interaction domain-containing protein n=1 Tax=Halopseudomonas maritima TaxID=2918528 RepID=UPI001EEA4F79|nr:sigma-54 dependent transcriptional regulator [Halopseudomonas maritima]UJJ31827.1 sigma-54 dependent transcriptional regulator [Halopseudomonas maritima]
MSSKALPVLVSWIGGNDLKAVAGGEVGPVLATLRAQRFARAELLCSYPEEELVRYQGWLNTQTDVPIQIYHEPLSSPVNFAEIHQAAFRQLERIQVAGGPLAILLSPGTPAMQAVWILLGKTRFSASFYQSSLEQGVQPVDIPFEIAAEYVPAVAGVSSESLSRIALQAAPVDAAFDHIVARSKSMLRLKQQAQVLAQKQVPVLVYGETGTGKELFARAIHNAGPRARMPFVAVNCGAIPADLIDSTLFGHKKGAFTGAVADRAGVFQQADGGTLFLDEFGELPPDAQVRLLRVLQEGTLTPVGDSAERRVNVRVIAATHRDLMSDVVQGRFREDLFYRIAVGVLHLPPLRGREGDLLLLADALLAGIALQDSELEGKKLSTEAKNIVLKHAWPGNVRELQATLLRAALWSQGDTLGPEDVAGALFDMPPSASSNATPDISQGIDINGKIRDFTKGHLIEALKYTGGNKTRAAELLGLASQQTLTNWMKKYDVE